MATDDLRPDPETAPSAAASVANETSIHRHRLVILILALAAASVAFRLLYDFGFRHSAAVFIGIPTLIALIVARSEKPATGTGVVMRVITLALLLSSIVFAEGMVCILFAAPIFYLVGYLVAKMASGVAELRRRGTYMLIMLVVLPTGLEGTVPAIEWNRDESVTASRVVSATPAQVRAALAGRPGFGAPLPPFLRLGFPVPVATAGSGLAAGDGRTIVFEHSHGGHRERGTLSFRIAESDAQSVRFEPVHDDSYVTHWLAWQSSEVRWRALSPGRTRVEWTLRYRRRLDPAWYFAPLERYGVGVAAGYLVDALATPGVDALATPAAPPAAMPVAEPLSPSRHHGS
jgi:hypothetical protein